MRRDVKEYMDKYGVQIEAWRHLEKGVEVCLKTLC